LVIFEGLGEVPMQVPPPGQRGLQPNFSEEVLWYMSLNLIQDQHIKSGKLELCIQQRLFFSISSLPIKEVSDLLNTSFQHGIG
jgi:hypothetical protein